VYTKRSSLAAKILSGHDFGVDSARSIDKDGAWRANDDTAHLPASEEEDGWRTSYNTTALPSVVASICPARPLTLALALPLLLLLPLLSSSPQPQNPTSVGHPDSRHVVTYSLAPWLQSAMESVRSKCWTTAIWFDGPKARPDHPDSMSAPFSLVIVPQVVAPTFVQLHFKCPRASTLARRSPPRTFSRHATDCTGISWWM